MAVRRRYSETDRATAMAALAANGGNVCLTAREIGIPQRTLQHWAEGGYGAPDPGQVAVQKIALGDLLEDLARKIMASLPGKVQDASFKDASIGLGIIIDKMRLVRDQPTTIDGQEISDDERVSRIRELVERAKRRCAGLSDTAGTPGVGPADAAPEPAAIPPE